MPNIPPTLYAFKVIGVLLLKVVKEPRREVCPTISFPFLYHRKPIIENAGKVIADVRMELPSRGKTKKISTCNSVGRYIEHFKFAFLRLQLGEKIHCEFFLFFRERRDDSWTFVSYVGRQGTIGHCLGHWRQSDGC